MIYTFHVCNNLDGKHSFLIVTANIWGDIHDSMATKLYDLKIPKYKTKQLMNPPPPFNAIKYLTSMILNKIKLERHQTRTPLD